MTTQQASVEKARTSARRGAGVSRGHGSRRRLGGLSLLVLLALLSVAAPARAADPERTPSVPAPLANDGARGAAAAALPAGADVPIVAEGEGEGEGVQGGSGTSDVIEYYGYDAVGSVRMVFDAAGNVVGQATYAPYGHEVYGATGTPSQRFTGQERDHEAGLDYFGARAYQVRTGRFGTVDPVWGNAVADPQRWNRYTYAMNSPLNLVDPTGQQPTIPRFVDSTTVVVTPGEVTYLPNGWGSSLDLTFWGNYEADSVDRWLQMLWEQNLLQPPRQTTTETKSTTCEDEGNCESPNGNGGSTTVTTSVIQQIPKNGRVPRNGPANSWKGFQQPNGDTVLRRYGPNGQPVYEFDVHDDHGPGEVHAHWWDENGRGPGITISALLERLRAVTTFSPVFLVGHPCQLVPSLCRAPVGSAGM